MEPWTFGDSLSTHSISILILLMLPSFNSSFRSSGFLGDLLPDTLCDLTHCWELYTSAQVSLRIHDDYPPTRLRAFQTEDIVVRCIAFRTFFLCLRNMSRTCLGDLNFHSAHKGVEKQMKTHNCSVSGRVFEPANADTKTHLPVCSFTLSQGSYKHCSIFGDPHIRTFDNVFQTCRLQGAWPVIDNEFFTVQVTSEHVGFGEGTAISKVTVLIKRHEDCALDQYISYQATSTELPATFDDGHTTLGRSDSIVIREVSANRHIEIYIRYIDTTIVLRLQNRFFAVSLRMPEKVVNDTASHSVNPLQLCLMSCPTRERIDIQRFILLGSQKLPHRTAVMAVEDALHTCQGLGLIDYYLDSCVFDFMITGDLNLTVLSLYAYKDAILLLPGAGSMLDNRTTLSNFGRPIFLFDYLLTLALTVALILRTMLDR